jgi:hypothetical protein
VVCIRSSTSSRFKILGINRRLHYLSDHFVKVHSLLEIILSVSSVFREAYVKLAEFEQVL